MAANKPPPLISQVPPPPSRRETQAESTQTLAWLQDRIAESYSLVRLDDESNARIYNLATYMQITTVIHDYCTGSKRGEGGRGGRGAHLLGEEIYRALEQVIRSCCQASLVHILASRIEPAAGDVDTATAVLSAYARRWASYLNVTRQMTHLFKFVDRHWVLRELDENKQANIWSIEQLHLKLWAEEVLDVVTLPATPYPGGNSMVLDAALELQERESENHPLDQAAKTLLLEVWASFDRLGIALGGGPSAIQQQSGDESGASVES